MNLMQTTMQKIKDISVWRILYKLAFISLILVVYSIGAEAYNLNKTVVWVKDKILNLSWENPSVDADHYRIEVTRTDLLSEPVTTFQSFEYTTDNSFKYQLMPDHSYQFRVQAITDYGIYSSYSDSTEIFIYDPEDGSTIISSGTARPSEFSLSQNYPNPFNSETTIEYQIPSSGTSHSSDVTLVIYNGLGQKIRELVDGKIPPGKYHAIWDGRDENGNTVASGSYLYLLIAGNYKNSKKMAFVK